MVIAGEAVDGEQTVAPVPETKPDIAIVDYSMPVMNSLKVAQRECDRRRPYQTESEMKRNPDHKSGHYPISGALQ